MSILKLSKTNIDTFVGNVVSLQLFSDKDISSENIIWSSSDDSIVYIRDFKTEGKTNFSDGVLLVMMGLGNAEIKAEYNGEAFTCTVVTREMKKADENDKFNFYFGDFHSHTSNNHDRNEFPLRTDTIPLTVLNEVKNEGFTIALPFQTMVTLLIIKNFLEYFFQLKKRKLMIL